MSSTNNEIAFETILRSGTAALEITDIYQKDNLTYFKINGHQYQTYAGKVLHKNSPMYDCPITKTWAADEHEPERIERKDKMMAEIDADLELWYRHRLSVFKIAFVLACQILVDKGDDEFLKFIDEHFFITAEPGAVNIIQKLENKCK